MMMALPVSAQWTSEWSSSSLPSAVVSGWLQFQQTGSTWDYRYYTLDTLAFRVMDGSLSGTTQYTYTFSAAERLAGELVYSLGEDLTGDGIVEFYVLAAYGTASAYRTTAKVFDITTGNTIFLRDIASYSYTAVSIWDANNDGTLDGVFTRYDYPSGANYAYEVYNTGVAAGISGHPQTPRQFDLHQNYPNPFNPSTRIDYELNTPGRVELEIMNVLGQRVRTVVDESQGAGRHSTLWDGKDASGNAQASGPYYYQIRIDGKAQQTRQMLLLK